MKIADYLGLSRGFLRRMTRPALLVALLGCSVPVAEAQPLPAGYTTLIDPLEAPLRPDPSFQTGTLDNGARYIVRSHAVPTGQVTLRLVADAGSFTERSDERGAAFLTGMLLHAASVESRLGRAVLDLGEALPARRRAVVPSITHDAAAFTVTLPIADEKALRIGLRYLASLADPASISDDLVLQHRPAVLAHRASRTGLKERLIAAVLPQLNEASRWTAHPAVPPDDALCILTTRAIAAFHTRRYAPQHLIILAAGDAPTEHLIECIRQEFGGLVAFDDPTPEPPPANAPTPRGMRAAVAADPEMTQAVAEIVVLHPDPPPVRTVGRWRAMLLDRVAAAVLHRSLTEALDREGGPARGAGIRIGPSPGTSFAAVASVAGEPSDWKGLVAEVAARVSRAAVFEPTPQEFESAVTNVRRSLEDAADQRGVESSELIDRATSAALAGAVLMSPVDESELASRWLRTITPAEVTAAIAERFRMIDAAFVLFLPQRTEQPSSVDVLTAALPAVVGSIEPTAKTNGALPETGTLLPEPPQTTRPESLALDPQSGVTTARFDGGVRVRHRFMPTSDSRVFVSVMLTDPPEPVEGASTAMTVALFAQPAAENLGAKELKRLLTDHRIELRAQTVGTGVRLELACQRDSVERALQVTRLLLTRPRLEAGAFERWRWTMIQRCRTRAIDPEFAADEAAADAVLTGRQTTLLLAREEQLRSLTLERLQRMIVEALDAASVDAAIVGDLPRADALPLAARYLGSLANRSGRAESEEPHARPLPIFKERRLQVQSPTPEAVVVVGIHGGGSDAQADAALDLAARILTSRLDDPVRGAARAVNVRHVPAGAVGTNGLLFAIGATDPDSAIPLAAAMEQVFTALARHGPRETELIRARADAIDEFDRNTLDAAWWARMLASRSGPEPADIARTRERLAAVTPDSLRRILAAHDPPTCCGGRRLRIIVTPTGEACDPR